MNKQSNKSGCCQPLNSLKESTEVVKLLAFESYFFVQKELTFQKISTAKW